MGVTDGDRSDGLGVRGESMLTGYGDYGRAVWKVVFFGLTGQSLFNTGRREGMSFTWRRW